jgi:hypothetical protein
MKNIQVIDGAVNCSYAIYAANDADFALMFPRGRDIEFIKDFFRRVGKAKASAVCARLWENYVEREDVRGIHGTLFYQLDEKKVFYPTKKWKDSNNVR